MGAIDKFLNVMKFSDEDDENQEDFYDEGDEAPVPKKNKGESSDGQEEKPVKRMTKLSGMKTNTKKNGGQEGMELCVIRPTTIDDGREITETLLSNRAVVLNLEGLDMDIAQRIIDFTSGSCFAIRGNMQKISHFIFVITPPSVDISGDFQDAFGMGAENGNGDLNVPPMSE